MSYKKIIVNGNLTRDPELVNANGGKVCRFTVAVNEWAGTDVGEVAEYMNVSVWGQRGENIFKSLKKGDGVIVEGRPKARAWTGNDGTLHAAIDIRATEVGFTYGRKGTGGPTDQPAPAETASVTENESAAPVECEDDAMPF